MTVCVLLHFCVFTGAVSNSPAGHQKFSNLVGGLLADYLIQESPNCLFPAVVLAHSVMCLMGSSPTTKLLNFWCPGGLLLTKK